MPDGKATEVESPWQAPVSSESAITLKLLNAVHDNSALTQRGVASDLGIALGLTNAYLKRCIRKGLIKVQQIPRKRYAYYLTPHGFAEKSRLTAEYLTSSFNFFRRARQQISQALEACAAQRYRRVVLVGASDLAEIATLCARDYDIELIAVMDGGFSGQHFAGLPVVRELGELGSIEAFVLTDMKNAQESFERLASLYARERIIVPRLLGVAAARPAPVDA